MMAYWHWFQLKNMANFRGSIKKTVCLALLCLEGLLIAIYPLGATVIFVIFVILIVYLWKPRFSLYTCIALAPITSVSFSHTSPTTFLPNLYPISCLAIILAFIFWVVRFLLKASPQPPWHDNSIYVLPLTLWLWAVVSLFWSLDLYHGFSIVTNFGCGLMLFFLLTNSIIDEESLISVLRFMALLGVSLTVATLASKYYSYEYTNELLNNFTFRINLFSKGGLDGVGQRPGGFASPMIASNVLGFFIFMNFALLMKIKKMWGRILIISCCIFIFQVMVLTASKGGILAFMGALFLLVLFYRPLREHFFSASIAMILLVLGTYVATIYLFQDDRLAGSSGSAAVAEASFSIRLDIWVAGFKAFADRWIGAGAGGVTSYSFPLPGAHNVYFSVLFDLGLPGVAVFLIFIATLFMRIMRAIKTCKDPFIVWALYCSCASLVMFLVHALVDLFYYEAYFWLVSGVALSLCSIAFSDSVSKSRSGTAVIGAV